MEDFGALMSGRANFFHFFPVPWTRLPSFSMSDCARRVGVLDLSMSEAVHGRFRGAHEWEGELLPLLSGSMDASAVFFDERLRSSSGRPRSFDERGRPWKISGSS